MPRQVRSLVSAANEHWDMDSVIDLLTGGRMIRMLTVVDVLSGEHDALVPQRSFRIGDARHILNRG